MAGTAAALMGAMMMAGSFVVGTVVAGVYDGTSRPMTLAIFACGVLQWATFDLLVRRLAVNRAADC
jgi:hypothetical protein